MKGFVWKCLGTIAAVIISVYVLPGIVCQDMLPAVAVGLLLAFAYLLLRPVARILLGVFNLFTLGMMGIIIDAGLFYACAMKIEGFAVESFAWALAAALIVNASRMLFGMLGKVGHA